MINKKSEYMIVIFNIICISFLMVEYFTTDGIIKIHFIITTILISLFISILGVYFHSLFNRVKSNSPFLDIELGLFVWDEKLNKPVKVETKKQVELYHDYTDEYTVKYIKRYATFSEVFDHFGYFVNSNKNNMKQLNDISLGKFGCKGLLNLTCSEKLSEEFIRKSLHNFDEACWNSISYHQKLSEEFIREFYYLVDWYYISQYQKLSEEFIREFKDKLNWTAISTYQKLSEEFIEEMKDYVEWYNISTYQKLSEPFIEKYNLEIDPDNWLYKDEQFKLEELKKCGLYEISEDQKSFIAYKGIRSDRYSKFNFQYQYLKDEFYECHTDHTIDPASFGLSVWTEEKAKEYCGEMSVTFQIDIIIKVEIQVKDIARIVHDGGKIRCTKFKVLT